MSFKRILSTEAESDLQGIYDYYLIEKDNEIAAQKVDEAIFKTFDLIQDLPLGYAAIEPPRKGKPLSFPIHMRIVKKYEDYLVFYTVDKAKSEVK